MPNSPQAVADHYKKGNLAETILAALTAAGKDIDRLTIDDLAPVDEFHTGGRNATARLAQMAEVGAAQQVLDVGCGIGGPSRYLASAFGCQVTGLDLTAEYIAVAQMLAQRVGRSSNVSYRQGDALDLPFADAAFDLVWSQNAAMNIENRERFYDEMRRVLKKSGRLAHAGRNPRSARSGGLPRAALARFNGGGDRRLPGARQSHRSRRAAAARHARPDRQRISHHDAEPAARH